LAQAVSLTGNIILFYTVMGSLGLDLKAKVFGLSLEIYYGLGVFVLGLDALVLTVLSKGIFIS